MSEPVDTEPTAFCDVPAAGPSVTFRCNVHGFKTDTNGGMTLTLKLFDVEKDRAKEILDLIHANAECALVGLPE